MGGGRGVGARDALDGSYEARQLVMFARVAVSDALAVLQQRRLRASLLRVVALVIRAESRRPRAGVFFRGILGAR